MESLPILVVEDNLTLQRMVHLFAKRRGLTIKAAGSCGDALEAIGQEAFALILMDWTLPDVDGLNCTRMIRQMEALQNKHTPIIAMTGNMMPGDKERCLESGMDDFLGKPFTLAEFNALVDRWLPLGPTIIPFPESERPHHSQSS